MIPNKYQVGIYLLKVSNRNIRTWCEICSKLTLKTPKRRQWLKPLTIFAKKFHRRCSTEFYGLIIGTSFSQCFLGWIENVFSFQMYKAFESIHCWKNVRIWSFSGSYCPAFGLNTERHGVSLHIHSECEKIRTIKTTDTDAFHTVIVADMLTT